MIGAVFEEDEEVPGKVSVSDNKHIFETHRVRKSLLQVEKGVSLTYFGPPLIFL